ncbi:MAG: (2Fe-2S)-binding protein [Actinomycetota bacterium]|jgi:bacterioferritin-associated ferredoxin|nr:(2Fe-2S)-binding protein [Actinomycetota bacterium]MDQ3600994.1 (2Fe-2S)-binding protein [Actinomycetota bacterium]
MYVCICAGVTDAEVRACSRAGARTPEDVGDRCGAGTGCGTCYDHIDTILAATAPATDWHGLTRSA